MSIWSELDIDYLHDGNSYFLVDQDEDFSAEIFYSSHQGQYIVDTYRHSDGSNYETYADNFEELCDVVESIKLKHNAELRD